MSEEDKISPFCPECGNVMGSYHEVSCEIGREWLVGKEQWFEKAPVRVDQLSGGDEYYTKFIAGLLSGG